MLKRNNNKTIIIMNFIFSALTVFAFVLCTLVFIYFLDYGRRLRKEEFIEIAIDRASHIVSDKMNDYWKKHKTGPWYLVVYTQDSNYPIWISNNTIRSVHPDPEHCKIIVKQFNGEDMVIENVINYDMRAANKLFDYEM